MKNKSNKIQKPGYLVFGSLIIALVAILVIYFVMILLGLVQVSKNHILIVTDSADKMYDGTPLTTDEDAWHIADGELLSGHTVDARVIGSQTEPGESDNIISVKIYDSAGADVTGTYEIEYQLGKLAVHGKRLEFYTGSAQKYYDGEPLSCDEWGFLEENSEDLLTGHAYSAYCSASITNIGEIENTLNVTILDTLTGKDVTSYYDIVVNSGLLTVSPIRLVVSFNVDGTVGSGGGTVDTKGVIISGNVLEGHQVKWEPIGTDVAGVDIQTIFVYVVDENGEDVTEYYEVVYPFGNLTIENPETFFPNIPENLYDTSDYKDLLNSLDEDTKKALEELLNGSGTADDLPPELAALALTPVYTVIADKDGTVYLRQQSYGDFDGNDWTDPIVYNGITPYTYSQAALSANGYSSTGLMIRPIFDSLSYVLPYYYVSGEYLPYNDCFNEGNPTVNQYYRTNYIPYNYTYTDNYTIPQSYYSSYAEYSAFVYNNYLTVDEETKTAILKLASEYDTDPDTEGIQPFCDEYGNILVPDAIEQVAAYIQSVATYSLSFEAIPDGENKIIYFMTQSKQGVCRHFAAAATLLYRALGIPARYVTGFAVNAEAGQDTIVTAMMAHAWVEVFVEGFGWVQIEATPSSGIMDGIGSGSGGGGGGGGGGNGSGISGGMEDGQGESGSSEPIFGIFSHEKGTVYMREKSFGNFNNDTGSWEAAGPIEMVDPFMITLNALSNSGVGTFGRTLYVEMLVSNYPYMLPYYASEYDYTKRYDTHVEGSYVVNEPYKVTYTYYDYIEMGGNIKVDSIYSDYEKQYAQLMEQYYTHVDDRTLDGYTTAQGTYYKGLNQIIEEQGWRNIKDQYQLIATVKQYVQTAATYTVDFPTAPYGEDKVLFFLNDSKQGKCSHYATAGTLIFRALGIPARYTGGYMVNVTDTTSYTYVTGRNAHAWVEIYLEGAGWIKVEVTGSGGLGDREDTVSKYGFTMPTPSYEKYYDGTEISVADDAQIIWSKFSQEGWTATEENGRIKWTCENAGQIGHWFYQDEVTVIDDSITEVGSKYVKASFRIRDSVGNDVTDLYDVEFSGTLKIKPIEVYVTSGSKTFDGLGSQGGRCYENLSDIVIVGTADGGFLDDADGVSVKFLYTSDYLFEYYGQVANEFEAVIERNGVTLEYYIVKPIFGTIEII